MSANFHRLNSVRAGGQPAAQSLHGVPGQSIIHPGTSAPLPLPDLTVDLLPPWLPQAEQPVLLTDDLLLHHQRCNRRSFLDMYGSRSDRNPPTDYLAKLRQDSVIHQVEVLGQHQPAQRPHYPPHDWQAGIAATLELMHQGVERIAYGVLGRQRGDRIQFVSYPKLLLRQPGQSDFGNWSYVPVEIKLGKRPKLDYQVVAMFHAYLLAEMQGASPVETWLILRQRGYYAVDLAAMLPRLQEVLQDCLGMLVMRQEPEVFIAHSRCDLCHWFNHCYQTAQSQNHLSLLPGVTPSRYVHLQALQLTTVEALAQIAPKKLETLPGFGPQVAHKLVRQAQAVVYNTALLYTPPSVSALPMPLLPQELPSAEVELYFDIEAAPEYNLTYLHGILVVDRRSQTEHFHPLFAESVEQEPTIWQQFLDLVGRYPNAPIFHFCPYEAQTVRKLAQAYHTPEDEIEPLLQRFVDVHERITRVTVLPIESYALKPIARWVGFDWRDADANGAQSICWYHEWRTTGDRQYLDALLRYNEDDCRATYRVKTWLTEFLQIPSEPRPPESLP